MFPQNYILMILFILCFVQIIYINSIVVYMIYTKHKMNWTIMPISKTIWIYDFRFQVSPGGEFAPLREIFTCILSPPPGINHVFQKFIKSPGVGPGGGGDGHDWIWLMHKGGVRITFHERKNSHLTFHSVRLHAHNSIAKRPIGRRTIIITTRRV